MSIRGLLFQWANTIKIQLSVLLYYKADLIIISLKINLSSPWNSWLLLSWSYATITHSLTHSLLRSLKVQLSTNNPNLILDFKVLFTWNQCIIDLINGRTRVRFKINLKKQTAWTTRIMQYKTKAYFNKNKSERFNKENNDKIIDIYILLRI